MDKKVLLVIALCVIGFIGFYSYMSSVNTNDTVVAGGETTQPEVSEPKPELNSILLQRTNDKYICWKKKDFTHVSSDKSDFEFRFEENKYRLYIVSDNTRVLNFRGSNWERAAYYLGVELPKCIEGR